VYGYGKLEVDHKEEVIEIGKTLTDYSIIDLWWRINCDVNNLQLLCRECHAKKTACFRSMKASYNKYLKHKDEKDKWFVLFDGKVVRRLQPEHKHMISKVYKTEKGAVKYSKKVVKC